MFALFFRLVADLGINLGDLLAKDLRFWHVETPEYNILIR